MRLFRRKPVSRQARNRLGQVKGYGGCFSCGDTWDWAEVHSTSYGDEGRACFPLCETCWQKLTPETRLPYYSMLVGRWISQGGPLAEEKWPEIRVAVEAGL